MRTTGAHEGLLSSLPSMGRGRGGVRFVVGRCGSRNSPPPNPPPFEGEGFERRNMALDPETFEALLGTVRRYVAERLRPLEAEVAEADEVPDEVVREMRDMGLFGLSIPEEYGGLGLS